MGNIFAITTAANDIKADAVGKASAIFTVTNISNKPVRGIARAKALGSTQQDWLEVEGETERDFGAGGTQQFTVNFKAAGAPTAAGKFPFRLDVASAIDPDEEFTEGPTVTVATAGAAPAPVAKKGFPLWIIVVIVAVALLIGGLILFLVLRGGDSGNTNQAVNANKTVPTPATTPTQPVVTPPVVVSTPALKSVTDGARYRDERNGAIYLGIDGKLRHATSGAIMNNLFKDWSAQGIPNADEYPIGPPLVDGTYLAKSPAPETYLVVDGQKRWIPSPVIFDRYNFNGGAVQQISPEQLARIPTGPNVP